MQFLFIASQNQDQFVANLSRRLEPIKKERTIAARPTQQRAPNCRYSCAECCTMGRRSNSAQLHRKSRFYSMMRGDYQHPNILANIRNNRPQSARKRCLYECQCAFVLIRRVFCRRTYFCLRCLSALVFMCFAPRCLLVIHWIKSDQQQQSKNKTALCASPNE